MPDYRLGTASLRNLEGVHPDLQDVIRLAITLTDCDFSVVEGVRDIERQQMLVESGKSKTLDSYHLVQADGYGHAVDVYPWRNSQSDHSPDAYALVASVVKEAAERLGVSIEWGGDWQTFVDRPHWQIPR